MATRLPKLLHLSLFVALASACTDPPKPVRVSKEALEKIEKEDTKQASGKTSELGPVPQGPVASVGSVKIPRDAFMSIYDLKVKKYTDRGREIPTSADRRYRKSIAERLVYHEVLRQEAERAGVAYDKEALASRETQQKRGVRDWEQHLKRRGETEDSLRAMYIAELREKAILAKNGKLEVSDDEIDADYEKVKGNWKSDKPRVRASQILVPTDERQQRMPASSKQPELSDEEKAKKDAEAKAKAEELYKLVTAKGADFAKIAAEHSHGPSAAKGGDIGIITPDRMIEEFSKAAFAMKVGEISKPVKSKFGYHIIKVTGKWGAGDLPKEALKDRLVGRLQQRKLHQGRRQLKEELLEKYAVVDNIKPTLGPEPERKRPKPRRHPNAAAKPSAASAPGKSAEDKAAAAAGE